MNKEQLIIRATELGIQDAGSLTVDQLKVAIKAAEQRLELNSKALNLGIETPESLDLEELKLLVLVTESNILAAKVSVFSTVLGLEGTEELSVEELEVLVKEKFSSFGTLESSEGKTLKVVKVEGKDSTHFKVKSGKSYQFNDEAPAAFRYAAVLKTQEEWLKDSDSLELMVLGNLSYVSLVNIEE